MTRGDRDDAAIRAALADLRAADEREAPAFDAILARRASSLRARPHVGRLAIAAGLVLAAVGVYSVLRALGGGPRLTVPREVAALSTWRPVTDVLLETPARDVLRHMPRLGSSLIDISITGDFR
jgi:hypothetical protein